MKVNFAQSVFESDHQSGNVCVKTHYHESVGDEFPQPSTIILVILVLKWPTTISKPTFCQWPKVMWGHTTWKQS